MSQRYLGGIITANPTTPALSSASGVWTLEQQLQYSQSIQPKVIPKSVRLRASASAYFNRTPASAGNRKTWTFSTWVKLGSLSTTLNLLYAYSADSDSGLCQLSYQSNQLRIQGYSASFLMVSTAVYRDPSAWYHVVYKVDTTQATAADRVRVYVNGVEIANGSASLATVSNSQEVWIGRSAFSGAYQWVGDSWSMLMIPMSILIIKWLFLRILYHYKIFLRI